MLIKQSWAVPSELGDKLKSKTVALKDYDFNAQVCYIVAKAWMLHRSLEGGWRGRKRSRARAWADWVHDLKVEMAALGSPDGKTGCAAADAQIAEYCPDVFL